MKYMILSRNNVDDLSLEVTDALAQGWQLYGNPFAQIYGQYNNVTYFQAVIRYDDELTGESETDGKKEGAATAIWAGVARWPE